VHSHIFHARPFRNNSIAKLIIFADELNATSFWIVEGLMMCFFCFIIICVLLHSDIKTYVNINAYIPIFKSV